MGMDEGTPQTLLCPNGHEVQPGVRFCPECGAEDTLRKAFAAPAVHFKGSGWAKKDRSTASTKARAKSESGSDTATKAGKSGDDGAPSTGSASTSTSGSTPSDSSSTGGASTPSSDAAPS